MKVFHFDPVTGKRGAFIENTLFAHALANPEGATATLPRSPDAFWTVATSAQDRSGKPIAYDFPVCFCTGFFTAGTDSAWHWHALLPAKKS